MAQTILTLKQQSLLDFLAKQLLQVNTLKDYPHMIKKISQTDLKNFWVNEIQHFKKEALI